MVEQTVQGIERIKNTIDSASQEITVLGERSQEIGKIVAVSTVGHRIDEIAGAAKQLEQASESMVTLIGQVKDSGAGRTTVPLLVARISRSSVRFTRSPTHSSAAPDSGVSTVAQPPLTL